MDDINLKPGEVTVAYFLRHGQTADNAKGFYKPENAELDKKGLAQSHAAKKFFDDKELGQAYTDDSKRTRQTADIVLGGRKHPIEIDQRLGHFNVGDAAGKPKKDFAEIAKKVRQDKNTKFPGSDESLNDFDGRVRKPLLKALRVGLESGKPSFITTHDSVLHSLGRILHNNSKSALVHPGGVVRVVWDGKNRQFKSQAVFGSKDSNDREVS